MIVHKGVAKGTLKIQTLMIPLNIPPAWSIEVLLQSLTVEVRDRMQSVLGAE